MTALALKLDDWRLPDTVRRNWRAWAVLGAMAALWLAAAVSVTLQSVAPGDAGAATSPEVARIRAAATAASATALRPVAPTTALALNAAIPVSQQLNPAAAPFHLRGSAADQARSLDCLTAAIYYEAATEPTDGQRAVAQVILNRVRHPAYPATVCGVVFEGARRATGCQFSFTCDGSLRRAPATDHWQRARTVAQAALGGYVYAPVGWATHYHANYVMPYWAPTLVKSANVGLHIFYRWRGGWGRPDAFVNHYAGIEPAIAWRGGFGQPLRSEVQLAASVRDAAAAQAAAAAALAGNASVDSFQRAVLRRYEPLQRETASAMISDRARADTSLSNSQRWALTGADSGPAAQAPLGRRAEGAEQPRELQGVRYRWDPAPPATPSGGGGTEASETAAH
ncbi:MAG TPA: cell wall hydrolase [Allosphingosinicella sp.]|nr:cell wall hydrolase [Allosphingosinicella sp.]